MILAHTKIRMLGSVEASEDEGFNPTRALNTFDGPLDCSCIAINAAVIWNPANIMLQVKLKINRGYSALNAYMLRHPMINSTCPRM